MLADSRGGVDSYVVVGVSAERLRAFHAEGLDLKSLLIEGSKDGWYLAETPNGFGDPLVLQEQSGAVVERNLTPEDDFRAGRIVVYGRSTEPASSSCAVREIYEEGNERAAARSSGTDTGA